MIKESFIALAYYIVLHWLVSMAGLEALRRFLWLPVEMNALVSIETKTYDHLMKQSCEFHDRKQSGELLASVGQGESVVELLEILLYKMTPVAMDLVVACFYFYFLFDAYLVLIGIAGIVLYLRIAVGLNTARTVLRRECNVTRRQNTQVMYDTFGSWRAVSYFDRTSHAQRIYQASVLLFRQSMRKYLASSHLGLQSLVLDLCGFTAFGYAAYGVVYGNRSVGTFVTLVTYWPSFIGSFFYLIALYVLT